MCVSSPKLLVKLFAVDAEDHWRLSEGWRDMSAVLRGPGSLSRRLVAFDASVSDRHLLIDPRAATDQ